jgi:type IV pilus biogenesis protein CpaD/CtpE
MVTHSPIAIVLISIGLGLTASPHAALAQSCDTVSLTPRLELTMPRGCLTEAYIKRQMATPSDAVRPQPEAKSSSDRRIKHIRDWAKGAQPPIQSSEAAK